MSIFEIRLIAKSGVFQMSNKRKTLSYAAAGLLSVATLVGTAGIEKTANKMSWSFSIARPALALAGQRLPGSLSGIISRVSSAVVSIRVTGLLMPAAQKKFSVPESFKRYFPEDFMKHFDPGSGGFEQVPRRAPKAVGVGSGFFIDSDGHVVTNNHVVGDAAKIEVTTKGGSTYEAELVGRDLKTDLALLKVNSAEKFSFVRFADSAQAKVGDWVITLGNPFGLGHTATTGIVSARGRNIGAGPYDDFLQIDAPINRGNSGGPTFNLHGEVVGINTAIISPTGVSAGIGFAVPSNMAKNVIDQLKRKGSVSRGWLGINIQKVTEDIALGLGIAKPEGVLISMLTKNGPAETAGLRVGDVIVDVNGERIAAMHDLPRRVATIKAGRNIPITVFRNGSKVSLNVKIGSMPMTRMVAENAPENRLESTFGMQLAVVDDALRARFGLRVGDRGVVIISVNPEGLAAEKGIRSGDIIHSVSGVNASTPAAVLKVIANAKLKMKTKARTAIYYC